MDRKFVFSSLIYAIVGMSLGIYMAASKNHGQLVTHAHIMLAGFVVSFIYGVCHKLWLANTETLLARVQFAVHQLGVSVLVVGLFLLYGNFIPLEVMDPILAVASIVVLTGMVLMSVLCLQVWKANR